MKRIILLVCVIIFTFSSAIAQDGEAHLFILSGQSNMKRFKPDQIFTPILNNTFGKEKVIVVKDAQGGKSISRWYKGWKSAAGETAATSGDLYDRLLEKVNLELAEHMFASVTFIWMQGEKDAKDGNGAVYAESLVGLFKQLKEDLNRADINFIIGRLSDFDLKAKKCPDWNVVRAAQMKVAQDTSNAVWIDCDDLNDGAQRDGRIIKNGLHYSMEGYKLLGKRFAEASIALINKSQ